MIYSYDVIYDYGILAVKAAKKSTAIKRKVGAVAVGPNGHSIGWNINMGNQTHACEDSAGDTFPEVMHAEVSALKTYLSTYDLPPTDIHVTHEPCQDCMEAIRSAGIEKGNIHIVEQFLKFDELKSRVDLLPESIMHFVNPNSLFHEFLYLFWNKDKGALVSLGAKILEHTSLSDVGVILAHGAKKYKPNNWRNADDVNRYWAALGRHILDLDVDVKSVCNDSGLSHAAHAMCNVIFILELEVF